MAVVDPFTIYAFTAGVVVVIILIVTLINKFSTSSPPKKRPADGGDEGRPVAAAAPRAGGMRRRVRAGNRMALRNDSDDEDNDDVMFGDGPQKGDEGKDGNKIGAKKARKLQEKAEKKEMRLAEERDREERKKREKELEEKRKKEEELEKQEAAIQEEEERKRKEEQERIEHEEYLKMKEMFSVDEEGEGEQEADLNSESLLEKFINYIKETKVVMLEDLAGHFGLKTQDVINRVQDLQKEGRLTGVIDDRGKFIYVTMDELEAVARYIRQNGRVSIADLAASSNRLISLEQETSSVARKMAAEATEMAMAEEAVVSS